MDFVAKALKMGILSEDCAKEIMPDQMWAVRFMTEMAGNEKLHSRSRPDQVAAMRKEIDELNDIIDLEECCLFDPTNSFSREKTELAIPESLAPFMNEVILPILRRIVQKGY